jgi:TRAP transporter solute receptor, TAXI family
MRKVSKIMTGMLTALAVCAMGLPVIASAAPALKERYVFTAQEAGSSMLVYTTTITGFLAKYLPESVKLDINPSGGTVASASMVQSGKADVGWAEASALWAYEGKILYKAPHGKIRAVAGGVQASNNQAFMTSAFSEKYGVKTFEDLKAKKPPVRIFTKKRGSMGQAVAPLQLEAYGITYDDIKAWGGVVVETGLGEIIDALRDNRGDLWLDNFPPGQSAATELCQTADVRMLKHTEAGVDYLTRYGFYKGVTPAGTWKVQTEDVLQPVAVTILITSADQSDEFVYLLTKALCENADGFRKSMAGAAKFDEKTAWKPEKTLIPLHPGAEKYYREVGWMQ